VLFKSFCIKYVIYKLERERGENSMGKGKERRKGRRIRSKKAR